MKITVETEPFQRPYHAAALQTKLATNIFHLRCLWGNIIHKGQVWRRKKSADFSHNSLRGSGSFGLSLIQMKNNDIFNLSNTSHKLNPAFTCKTKKIYVDIPPL